MSTEKTIQTNPNDLHRAAEQATGCHGAMSYLDWAVRHGFEFLEVVCWGCSAGNWQFIVSQDSHHWQVLFQENNYPRPGFSHSLGDEVYEGTATEVLERISEEG